MRSLDASAMLAHNAEGRTERREVVISRRAQSIHSRGASGAARSAGGVEVAANLA